MDAVAEITGEPKINLVGFCAGGILASMVAAWLAATDIDSTIQSYTVVTGPTNGTLSGTAPNLTYTPNAGYTGPDFFTFQVLDSLGAAYPSAPGTVSVIVGTAGSGVPALMDKLLEANNIDRKAMKLSNLEQTPATVAFLSGELDAIVFASAPESQMVQMLLQTPGIKLLDFPQSEAYSRRFPFLAPVVLPRGIVHLARDLPSQNVRLVATTTALLTRGGTHPALQQLFAQEARDLHGPDGTLLLETPEGEKRVDGARRQNDWILDVEVDSTRPEMVNQILADLVQRETKNQSARFAQILAASIGEHGWPTLQNTHRKKGLYVLLSPDVPAALLEMGFITNEDDVAAMTSETKRKKLVQGVAHAIDQFFDSQTRMVAVR